MTVSQLRRACAETAALLVVGVMTLGVLLGDHNPAWYWLTATPILAAVVAAFAIACERRNIQPAPAKAPLHRALRRTVHCPTFYIIGAS